jgi:hypothetical protein
MARRDRGAARLGDPGDQRIAQIDGTADSLAVGSQLAGGRRSHLVEGEDTIREVFRQDPSTK